MLGGSSAKGATMRSSCLATVGAGSTSPRAVPVPRGTDAVVDNLHREVTAGPHHPAAHRRRVVRIA